jgi:integrase
MVERVKLTQKMVEAEAPGEARRIVWDATVPGLGLRVEPSGRKVYLVRYRVGGGRTGTQREATVGQHGVLTLDEARRSAKVILADAARGADLAADRRQERAAPLMNELFDRYLREHADVHKRASSVRSDRLLIEPSKREGSTRISLREALGHRKVKDVTRADVEAIHLRLKPTPYQANRTLALLSKVMNLAEDWKMRPPRSNPCYRIKKFREAKRERFLSPAELGKLGAVLGQAERDGFVILPALPGVRAEAERAPVSAVAVAAIRLLIFTGARCGEVLGLQWDWIDLDRGRVFLPDSKTGAKVLYLPPPAVAVLRALPRLEGNPHVLPGRKDGAHLVNVKDAWFAIREVAGLPAVRIHDLRHSFASVGASDGMSLPIIGALLGHRETATTARYAHLSDDPVRQAADGIGLTIAAALSGGSAPQRAASAPPLPRGRMPARRRA